MYVRKSDFVINIKFVQVSMYVDAIQMPTYVPNSNCICYKEPYMELFTFINRISSVPVVNDSEFKE